MDERPLRIETDRMELIASTQAMAQADADDDFATLDDLLDARIPDEWPPPLTIDARGHWARVLLEHPEQVGWWNWFFVRETGDAADRVLLGGAGFNGPPDEHGTVQVGYSVLPSFQLRGYATEGVRALLDWSFQDSRTALVTAQTFPDVAASLGVLSKLGMTYLDEGDEPGAILFGVTREGYAAYRAR